ncbi:nuclear pore complex subunit [Gaeumannomyces tritici R3-111a-1]|uniref:Nuclear pore complex subunit n=1 Tax=Gaeumannomyces tritici (strain R3-111a-1) TaxID=644352 RepID=J3NS19_GAET3|nr:nuclear pore complex subunit [Gaeumannomyces tritici R3-111a-1]EJT78975.1 nuclear pore complex subunit [Gaeumannomyces tritici R3-111a-1]
MSSPAVLEPPVAGDQARVRVVMNHGHQDLVQAVAFNSYGDRCATGSVDGKIRVFNRHQDGTWRQCDNWTAHGGDILELQWLPPTIFPNLIASLGIEGRFKLWAEDPAAAPGKRFSQRNKENAKAAYEHKSRGGAPYRSFSLRHNDETRHTHLALLAADGVLEVLENEQPENLADFNPVDRLVVCNPRPARGEETSFRVRFDPNPDPCYSALRAGVQTDSLALVVAAMRTVRIYRSRDASSSAAGPCAREFYLAAEISGHGGLVRDVAWAAGNIRGYDIVATACQDGFVRVVRLDTPFSPDDGRSWSSSDLVKGGSTIGGTSSHDASGSRSGASKGSRNSLQQQQQQQSQNPVGLPNPPPARSVLGSELAISSANADRVMTGQPGEARHVVRELSRLETHRTPVWRVGFDDDGQILGSVGDDGKLMCYRQTPDGSWAKSSELAMVKMRMAVPQTEPGS